MKKYLFLLLALVCSMLSFSQSKFYLMPEVGINSAITSSRWSNYQNTGYDIGLKAGIDVTANLALETGLSWSKIQSFPSASLYVFSPESSGYNAYAYNSTSSNSFFSIPLHLKLSHNVFNDKFKVFTFFGPRFIFGNMKYTKYETSNFTDLEYNGLGNSYGNYSSYITNSTKVSSSETRDFQPGILFDGGFGFEYQMNSHLSLLTKGSFSMGSKRLNSSSYLNSDVSLPSKGRVVEDNTWKGDGLSLSVGLKIKF